MGQISFVVRRICSKFVKTPTPRDRVEFLTWFEIPYSHIGSFSPTPPPYLVLPSFRPSSPAPAPRHSTPGESPPLVPTPFTNAHLESNQGGFEGRCKCHITAHSVRLREIAAPGWALEPTDEPTEPILATAPSIVGSPPRHHQMRVTVSSGEPKPREAPFLQLTRPGLPIQEPMPHHRQTWAFSSPGECQTTKSPLPTSFLPTACRVSSPTPRYCQTRTIAGPGVSQSAKSPLSPHSCPQPTQITPSRHVIPERETSPAQVHPILPNRPPLTSFPPIGTFDKPSPPRYSRT